MKTILVSGASGVVGYGILKSLRNASNGYRLIGTTIYNDSVAPAFCDIFELAPPTQDKNYLSGTSIGTT
jgi:carbamoyl-phosphate synthase large subunit